MTKLLNAIIIVMVIAFALVFSYFGAVCIRYPIKFKDAILTAEAETGVDKMLIISVARTESNFDEDAVSTAGAIGIMQLMPDTAEYVSDLYDLDYMGESELYNPESNILLGAYYLKYLLGKFESESTVLASYNAGEGVVSRWLGSDEYSSNGVTLETIPYKETRDYIQKVERAQKIYQKIWK